MHDQAFEPGARVAYARAYLASIGDDDKRSRAMRGVICGQPMAPAATTASDGVVHVVAWKRGRRTRFGWARAAELRLAPAIQTA